MSPRIFFRRPYPTHKDGSPIPNIDTPRTSRTFKTIVASTDGTALLPSMVVKFGSAPSSILAPSKHTVPSPESVDPVMEKREHGGSKASKDIEDLAGPGGNLSVTTVEAPKPKFAAASPEYHNIFASMAISMKRTTVAVRSPPGIDERSDSTPASATTAEISKEPAEEVPNLPLATTLSPEPNFAAAGGEYHGLGMAAEERKVTTAPPISITPPPVEAVPEPVPTPSMTAEIIAETVKETPPSSKLAVTQPEKPKFAAASSELRGLFSSMAIGRKRALTASSTSPNSQPHKRIAEIEKETATSEYLLEPDLAACPKYEELKVLGDVAETDTVDQDACLSKTEKEAVFAIKDPEPRVDVDPISLPPKVNFAAASHDYYNMFASMSIIKPKSIPRPAASSSISPLPTSNILKPNSATTGLLTPETSSTESTPPRRRPQTTDLVARRLIGAALGIKVQVKTDAKTGAIEKALRMKGKEERNAVWKEYVAGAENQEQMSAWKLAR